MPERAAEYPQVLLEIDRLLTSYYDAEPLAHRARFIESSEDLMKCTSLNTALRHGSKYHFGCAWRKAFLDVDVKSKFRDCYRASVWASTRAVLTNTGPPSLGTNQFYDVGTNLPPQVFSLTTVLREDLDLGGAGEEGPGTDASRLVGAGIKRKAFVDVVEGDIMTLSHAIALRGIDVLVLNMSNANTPGGGAKAGHSTQEEEIYRTTDISRHTSSYIGKKWPLESEDCAGIVSSGVSFLRMGEDFGYLFLPGNLRPQIDVISTCVQNYHSHPRCERSVAHTKKRIEALIKIGAEYDVCVCSAIGCGAYGHNAAEISKMFKQAIEKYGKGGSFIFAIRPTDSDVKHRRSEVVSAFMSLKSEPEIEVATGASRLGHDGGRKWSLSQLIVLLPMNVNNKGVLRKLVDLYVATGSTKLEEVDKVTNKEERDEEDTAEQPDDEDPATVVYSPACEIRHVWIGVARFQAKNIGRKFYLPECIDSTAIKKAAFLCIIAHLRVANKNLQAVLRTEKVHANMATDALGFPVNQIAGSPSMAGAVVYNRIRVPPYNFEKFFGRLADDADKAQWLQVNQSIPKASMRKVARFLTEVTCYASLMTRSPNPWDLSDVVDLSHGTKYGTSERTFQELYPIFEKSVAALYQKRYLRLIAPDSVGEDETDTFTVPSSLYEFRQAEWPPTLFFPASTTCPTLMPDAMLEAVLLAKRQVITRLALGNISGAVEDPEAMTGTTRRELSSLLGVKQRVTRRVRPGRRKNKTAAKLAASSAAAAAEEVQEESADLDLVEYDATHPDFDPDEEVEGY